MGGSVWDSLAPERDAVEAALAAAIPGDCPAVLAEALRYTLLGPGKRLRPLLTLLACEAAKGDWRKALPAACAVEMVHTYSLVHDDLPAMDDDDLRRGRPTCHKVYGEALAILAGDALLTLAFEHVAASYPGPLAAVCCLELARGAGGNGMVGGQVLDLAAEGRVPGERPAGLAHLEAIHRAKTGALFVASVRLGVHAAGGSGARLTFGDDCARAFGLAFQIADDLLDVSGSDQLAGKRVGKDAARGKLTYPGLLGVAESRARLAQLLAEAEAHAVAFGPAGGRLAALMRAVIDRNR